MVNRSSSEVKNDISSSAREIELRDLQKDCTYNAGSKTNYNSITQRLKLHPLDPEKPMTVTDNATGQSFTAENANVEIESKQENKATADTTAVKKSVNDKSEIDQKNTSDIKNSSDQSERNTNSETSRISTWVWVLVILAIAASGYFIWQKNKPWFLKVKDKIGL